MTTNAQIPWLVLQIADSGFPTGGFAHSSGLEASAQTGHVRSAGDLDAFLRAHLWSVGRTSLPYVAASHDEPHSVNALDELLDATLTNHIANRASRTQGRAFLATCARVFDHPAIAALAQRAAAHAFHAHFAVSFGAALAALRVARRDASALHLLFALRGVVSAAVRLGIVGPHEAQRIQTHHAATLDAVLVSCEALCLDDAASTAPLLDIVAATHDRLYARLFQS